MRSLVNHVLLIGVLLFTIVNASTSRSITIYTWPLAAAKPQQLAQVSYDSSAETATISKYSPPTGPFSADERIRVGYHDAKQGTWQGIVTTTASFDPSLQQKLSLLLDTAGNTYHIGFGAVQRPLDQATDGSASKKHKQKSAKSVKEEPLVVELVKPSTSPSPVLNKPVKLDPKGKVADNKEDEKTFLQKYWWAIAGFLLIQLVMGGAKE